MAAQLGVELTLDIGTSVYALETSVSVSKLGLRNGTEVWVSFKATDVNLVQEQSLES